MSALSLLLLAKIILTLPLINLYLFGDQKRLNSLHGQYGDNPMIYRFCGIGLLALVAIYGAALTNSLSGALPFDLILVGIVVNLGAATMLLAWNSHPKLRFSMWVFGGAGAGFLLTLAFPDQALIPLLNSVA
ncbi:hypothetical protein [Aliiroseovarius marinus]|uniref:hypothetical protein n=1 Tax=Aliiroseovarius marinus TaxID=2500159 RepID=UPI003D7D4FCE